MKCAQVEDALLDYLEGQLAEAETASMRAHFAQCPPCQSALEDVREMLGVLESARGLQERVWRGVTRGPAAPARAPAACQPGTCLGDFEILDELGRGGMGIVYRARQKSLNRLVALKVMPGLVAASSSAVTRFQREAQAAAKLHHTNIVPVYAQGEQDGHFYYAMELIDGVNLGHLLKHHPGGILSLLAPGSASAMSLAQPAAAEDAAPAARAAPPAPGPPADAAPHTRRVRDYRRLARLLADVADGLDHAHRLHVIHRDIKPQNLLLGPDGVLHITDFGLARLLDEPHVTVTGEMLGTPAYMSPEQVSPDRATLDHRTDIYSLGVTLYELLTGRRPFEGNTREQVIARIRTREPRPPRKCNPDIPLDLDTICLRAMEKAPARRYATAADMAADLRRYADDRPIVSRRVGPLEKAVKWVRRHPALTAILVLSAMLIAGASLWTRQHLRQRHDRATAAVHRAFNRLVFDDYRDVSAAALDLADARAILKDDPAYLITQALCNILDEPSESLRLVDQALALRPHDTEMEYLRAWALRRLERRLDYEAVIRRADEQGGPRTAAAHFFRAQALVRERPDDAVDNYRSAAALHKDNYQAVVHLGRCQNHWTYHHRRRDRYEELTRNLLAACTLRPDKAYPRYLLSIGYRLSAEMHRDEGRDAEAWSDFDLALESAAIAVRNEPASPRGYAAEAELWESVNDLASALDARNRGLDVCKTPDEFVEFLTYRWRIHYWLGRLDNAQQDLARLAELAPASDPRRHWYQTLFPALLLAESRSVNDAASSILAAARPEQPPRLRLDSAATLLWLNRPADAVRLLQSLHAGDAATPGTGAPDPSTWPRRHAELLLRACSLDDLRAAAPELDRDKVLLAAPLFLDAALAAADGRIDDARRRLDECERTYDFEDYGYLARTLARRLNDDPDWFDRIQGRTAP